MIAISKSESHGAPKTTFDQIYVFLGLSNFLKGPLKSPNFKDANLAQSTNFINKALVIQKRPRTNTKARTWSTYESFISAYINDCLYIYQLDDFHLKVVM